MDNSAAGNQDHRPEPSSISSTLLRARQSEATGGMDAAGRSVRPGGLSLVPAVGRERDDAPDVVQEVFAALAVHIDDFRRERPGDSFAAWLRTITQNKIRDHFRARHGRAAAEGGTEAQQRLSNWPNLPNRPRPATRGRCEVWSCRSAWNWFGRSSSRGPGRPFGAWPIERQPPVQVANELGMSIQAVYQAKSRVLRDSARTSTIRCKKGGKG